MQTSSSAVEIHWVAWWANDAYLHQKIIPNKGANSDCKSLHFQDRFSEEWVLSHQNVEMLVEKANICQGELQKILHLSNWQEVSNLPVLMLGACVFIFSTWSQMFSYSFHIQILQWPWPWVFKRESFKFLLSFTDFDSGAKLLQLHTSRFRFHFEQDVWFLSYVS